MKNNSHNQDDSKTHINIIEMSLLNDLLGLYTCDLTRERHNEGHHNCFSCAKLEIISAISKYKQLDLESRLSRKNGP